MSQSIYQWIWSTFNSDSILAPLWGDPASNPYSVAAAQATGATPPFPYMIYQVVGRKTFPVMGNAAGPGNTWIFSFKIWSQGTNATSGADDCRTIADRVASVLNQQMAPIGVQFCQLLLQLERWDEQEKAYQIVMDFEIRENLCNLG